MQMMPGMGKVDAWLKMATYTLMFSQGNPENCMGLPESLSWPELEDATNLALEAMYRPAIVKSLPIVHKL